MSFVGQDPAKTIEPPVPTTPPAVEIKPFVPPFDKAPAVDNLVRLALTPMLDGKIDPEEWEPLGSGTYLQWEPNVLYWAAEAKTGEAVVLSLDWNGDGWLVGDDNIEVRVKLVNGEPVMTMRRLDGTNPNGPQWVDAGILPESFNFAAKPTATGWTLEAKYRPILGTSPVAGKKLGARIDIVPDTSDLGQAFVPRLMAPITLQLEAGQGLPAGLSWKPEWRVRSVPVNDTFKVKYNFDRTSNIELRNVEFACEGLASPFTASSKKPFPAFDKKGRLSIEFDSLVGPQATLGWRILRAKVNDAAGAQSILRSSFRIADIIDFDVNLPTDFKTISEARVIKGSVYLRSQNMGRIEGVFNVIAPPDWSVVKGKDVKFLIYHSRGSQRIGIELISPQGAKGVFPLTLKAEVGGKVVEEKIFLPIR